MAPSAHIQAYHHQSQHHVSSTKVNSSARHAHPAGYTPTQVQRPSSLRFTPTSRTHSPIDFSNAFPSPSDSPMQISDHYPDLYTVNPLPQRYTPLPSN
eukprot:794613_1